MANRIEGEWELETDYGDVWDLRFPTGGISRITGIGLPPRNKASQQTPTEHGSELLATTFADREIVIGCQLAPRYTSSGDCMAEQRKRGPYRTLNYLAGPLTLRRTLSNHEVREQRRCDYDGGMERDSAGLWENLEADSFLLIGRDPAWYDPDSYSISVVYDDFTHGLYLSTVTIDDTDGLITNGDWYTFPTIAILGPCDTFDLVSNTTGQRLRYSYSIVGGETVTLTTNPKALSASSNVWGDVENHIPPSDNFGGFRLDPHPVATDGENEWDLEVSGIDANSTFTFTWEDRYQGI